MNVSISQAMAFGLPIITTKHSGLPEQVHDGLHGFLVDEGDYRALADKILYMIEHPEIWSELGKSGRKHVEQNYNAELTIQKQVTIYNKLLDESY